MHFKNQYLQSVRKIFCLGDLIQFLPSGHISFSLTIQILLSKQDTRCLKMLYYIKERASKVELMVKILLANAGDIRDAGSTPGSERSPGGGHGNPLQYSCLGSLMDRGAWQPIVQGSQKSQT